MSPFDSRDLEVVVSGHALRQALAAMLPHVGTGDCQEAQKAIRLVIDSRFGLVTTLASGGGSVAASMPIRDTRASSEPVLDVLLSASVAKLILAASKPTSLDEQLLSLGWSGRLWVTDVSGLLDGRALRVPALSWLEEGLVVPDVAEDILIAAALPLAGSATVNLTPPVVGRWATTARALGSWPLRVTTGHSFLVVGGQFGSTDAAGFVGTDWCPGAREQIAAPRTFDEPIALAHLKRLHPEQASQVVSRSSLASVGGAR
ncbi:Uncharacterised protein [Actinomyces bovis]|uniref:FAD-binding PCMH-type domain-containing protein n=1 Tax=Actinomyces bovis TaxID=1658 RepID=A0ABY1VQ27_9ACTO|nr:hypothetical protein [Actinomyces bovis]SPT53777.1 Uncharacterised protein [Actinomyces bovis]VEG53126.1 Uncharacterised protein [Actinomyces israelii]